MATLWAVNMISFPKLILIGGIIVLVWTLFRLIERRRAASTGRQDTGAPDRPVDTIECSQCNAFVSAEGCEKPDCPVRKN